MFVILKYYFTLYCFAYFVYIINFILFLVPFSLRCLLSQPYKPTLIPGRDSAIHYVSSVIWDQWLMDFWCRGKFLCNWDIILTDEVTIGLTDVLSSLKSACLSRFSWSISEAMHGTYQSRLFYTDTYLLLFKFCFKAF